ncbi:hypothetical protein KIL84_017240, partial [Mauremys mutica]
MESRHTPHPKVDSLVSDSVTLPASVTIPPDAFKEYQTKTEEEGSRRVSSEEQSSLSTHHKNFYKVAPVRVNASQSEKTGENK